MRDYEEVQYGEKGLLLRQFGLKAKKLTTEAQDKKAIEEIKISKITEKERLNFKISGNGANLSLGQCQLICIARALIKKPKILLMDEATANIDQKTDSIIQFLIKNNLKETTVVTIAHRLVTIMQYDKVIVMADGEKIEEGSPSELIERNGTFCELVEEGERSLKRGCCIWPRIVMLILRALIRFFF